LKGNSEGLNTVVIFMRFFFQIRGKNFIFFIKPAVLKRLFFSTFLLTTGLIVATWAQERTVTGKIISAQDVSPLPGVNIFLKGTTTGTVTDIHGNYRLSLPDEGGSLVFSFIGYTTQEIGIGAQSVIDVQMVAEVTQLSELVITSLGIERQKKALGYSVEKVAGAKVQQVAEPDPLRALQGKVAGVNILSTSGAPGSSTRITIRGNASLLNNNQPLFVVDGVPYNNDMETTGSLLVGGGPFSSRISDLDPNDIQSITVLKGGAAGALYGSRAANGVVVITTKSGAAKPSKKGLEVTYSMSYAIEKIGDFPNYQNTYGAGFNFDYQQANGSWGPSFIGATPYATRDSIPHWFSGRPGMEAFDGVKVPYQAYPDNIKDFFENGSILGNSLTISGGNEKSVLTVTLSQMKHEGFVPESKFQRHNISLGGKTSLLNGLTIGGNMAVTISAQDGPITGVGNLGANNPSVFARIMLLGRNWDLHGQPFQNPVDNGSEFMVGRGQANNPFWAVENSGIRSDVNRYVASINAAYDFTDWLSMFYRLGINNYDQNLLDFQRPNGTGTVIGTLNERNTNQTEINSDLMVTFAREFNENISLRILGGWNVNQRTTNSQQVDGSGYVIFHIDDLDNMSFLQPGGGDFSRKRIIGAFGDVTLGYRDWAFLTLTGRNDWFSTLPKENRSVFYPSLSTSIILTDAFDIRSPTLSFAKIRASLSQVGNDTDPYLINTSFRINNFRGTTAQKPFRGVSGSTLSNTSANPNLLPEITKEFEGGAGS